MDGHTGLVVAIVTLVITIAGVVYAFGRLTGSVGARLKDIERRLLEMDTTLTRMWAGLRGRGRGKEE